jgi:tetratricopeptide (TPR) repeat protein
LEHAVQTLPQNDPEFAEALLAAGNSATFEGKYQEAESLLARALDACLKIHGEKSSQTLFTLNRVCIIKRLLGKFDEAEDAIHRAVDGARAHFSDHGFYPWTLGNLALLREAEAKRITRKATTRMPSQNMRNFAELLLTRPQRLGTARAVAC